MPYIDDFRNRLKPGYDIPRLIEDIVQWLIEDCGGAGNWFNVWDAVEYYCGEEARQQRDYEALFFVQNLLSKAGFALEKGHGLFLAHEQTGRTHMRYIAKTQEEAEKHILSFSSRAVNAVTKASDKAGVGIDSYGLLPSNPILQIANKMAEVLPEAKQLRSGAKKYLKDKSDPDS